MQETDEDESVLSGFKKIQEKSSTVRIFGTLLTDI